MIKTFGRLSTHFQIEPEKDRIELTIFTLLVHDLKKLYSFVVESVELLSPVILELDPSIALAVYLVYVHVNAFTLEIKETFKR